MVGHVHNAVNTLIAQRSQFELILLLLLGNYRAPAASSWAELYEAQNGLIYNVGKAYNHWTPLDFYWSIRLIEIIESSTNA